MEFKTKSLTTLELPAVLALLENEAVSAAAKQEIRSLSPSYDRETVRALLEQTCAAKEMMVLKGSPTFSGVKDVRPSVARADMGGSLNTRELLDIAGLLRCARICSTYLADRKSGPSCIDHLFHALRANRPLEERIFTSIPAEEEIADSASPALADIRRKIRATAASAKEALQRILSSPATAKALQEPIITMRSDRFVVPVKADFKGSVPGLVHDVSSSGMTLFVEPMAAVKANNELRELTAREKAEIDRILAELSAQCAESGNDIDSDFSLLTRLDVIFAKAKLSYRMEASPAASSDGKSLRLIRARHPLLDPSKAVPISLELGDDYDTLVITGPNTGGKTVTLKTIGLLAAMNQCGLHIPAGDESCLPVFCGIYADIGDEQSIEQNLSTFSSHMKNIVSIAEECDEDSLVLFDELGAGTDPTEGAALAVAVIEAIRHRGALVAATTHYSELKVYATNTPGVQNASCEFDITTLRPTYRLLVGIPGKSNAFAIASRLGLSTDIIQDAEQRIGTSSARFEATIERLEQTRLGLEAKYALAEEKLKKASEDAAKAARLRAELEVRLDKAEIKARRDAERILAEARQTAEETFASLDEMRSRKLEEQSVHEINEARNDLRQKLNRAREKTRVQQELPQIQEQSARPAAAGDTVVIRSMGMRAEVVSVSPDGTLNLRAGIMNVSARQDEVLVQAETQAPKKKPASTGVTLRSETFSSSVDLRGMDSIDAVMTAEQYIDSAVMAGMKTVTVIHGKGTGALRAAVQKMLRTNRSVKSFRMGNFGEGESGVTVVELK